MNKEQFYNIISDSNLLAKVDEKNIDEIIKEFPYFQTAYILKTKMLSDSGSFKYDNFIKLASLYSADRSKLYEYLHSENKNPINSDSIENTRKEKLVSNKKEKKHIYTNKSKPEIEKITEPEPVEIKKQVKEKPLEIKKDLKRTEETVNKKQIEEINDKNNIKNQPEESKTIEKEVEPISKIDDKIKTSTEKEINVIDEGKNKDVIKEIKTKEVTNNKIEPEKTTISENASLAEKILHKYKDLPKDKNKESIADIILRKAAEAKKNKDASITIKKTKPVLTKKYEEIKVEQKTFEPVKLEIKENFIKENKQENKKAIKDDGSLKKEENKKLEDNIIEEITKITENSLPNDYLTENKIEKPIIKKEEMSFEDWLNFIDTPIQTSNKNKKQISLIDKFISQKPDIKINVKDTYDENAKKNINESEIERDDFITETLANIYIKQKLYDKAISAFTKLSLKYPEKNSYFANRIKKVKKLIKK